MLRSTMNVHSCLLSLSRQRILFAEAQIYNYIFSQCLPRARQHLQSHSEHPNASIHTCGCYEGVHEHEHWLIRLTLKIKECATFSPAGFTLEASTYLSALPDATPYVSGSRARHRYAVTDQDVINTLKAVLYQWLQIPPNKDAEFRAAMVEIFHKYLGAGSLLLPSIWQLCVDVPEWVYTDSQEFQSNLRHTENEPLRTFSRCTEALPAAIRGTGTRILLDGLWSKYKMLSSALRTNGRSLASNDRACSSTLMHNIQTLRLDQLKAFLVCSLQFSQGKLGAEHPCYQLLTQNTDFYLPLREHAPARRNFLRIANADSLKTPEGFFNLIVFRLLFYNSEASRTVDFNFTLQTLKEFRSTHERDFYYNSRAYGNINFYRSIPELMDLHWKLAHSLWPSFVAKINGTL